MLDLSRLVALADRPPEDPSRRLLDDQTDDLRTLARLEAALSALPHADREVLLLVAVEGLDQARAASVLGVGYDALRQRLSRARARLAAQLEKGGSR